MKRAGRAAQLESGRSSGVEHNLAKVGVEGSNPFARSIFRKKSTAAKARRLGAPARRAYFGPMMVLALLLAIAGPPPAPAPAGSAIVTTASGLRFETLAAGIGRRPRPGDAVLVTYEGRLADGTVFESTARPVGLLVSDLVPGFTEALQLMNEGGRYRFWIPAPLAYGAQGSRGIIPPDAELVFTLTLIDVGRPAAPAAR